MQQIYHSHCSLIQALTLLHWFAFKLDHFHADDEQKCIVKRRALVCLFVFALHCAKNVIYTLFLSFKIDHKQKTGDAEGWRTLVETWQKNKL